MNQSGQNLFRNSLNIFVRGLILGLGFGIAVAGIAYGFYKWEQQRYTSYPTSMHTPEERVSNKDFELSGVEEMKAADGRVWIIGSLKNNGAHAARGLQVQVNMFQGQKFVDQYSTYISDSVEPGQSRYFKIACGCKDSPPAEHDSFKVEVLGGY